MLTARLVFAVMAVGTIALAQVPSVPPTILSKTDVEYTPEARTAKVQGTVVLECDIGKDGVAHNVRVVQRLDPGLDQNAVEAVKHWRFQPGMKYGRQVVWKHWSIPVDFTLPKRPIDVEAATHEWTVWIVSAIVILGVLFLIFVHLSNRPSKDSAVTTAVSPIIHPHTFPTEDRAIRPPVQEPEFVSFLSIPVSETLPPSAQWVNRFEVRSQTSARRYVVAQHREMRHWACSCPGWTHYRHCKHVEALSLPPGEQPHEVDFQVTTVVEPALLEETFTPELNDFGDIDLSSAVPPRYVIFDLETTGLDSNKHEIIEIGAIRVNRDSTRVTTFHTLVKPNRRIPKFITQKTGILQEMVDQDGEQLETAIAEFATFIGSLPLVSYNADFDMKFLRGAARQHNIKVDNRFTCALKMARRAWPNLPSHKLDDIAEIMNFDQNVKCDTADEGAHRALGDCKRTMLVYVCAAKTLGYDMNQHRAVGA